MTKLRRIIQVSGACLLLLVVAEHHQHVGLRGLEHGAKLVEGRVGTRQLGGVLRFAVYLAVDGGWAGLSCLFPPRQRLEQEGRMRTGENGGDASQMNLSL